jgi:hypothetical protein
MYDKALIACQRLRKAADDPMPQQIEDPEPPEEINGEPGWEVEEVLASQLHRESKTLQCQVARRGCDPDEEWYLAGNLKNAAATLKKSHAEHPGSAGPPRRLQDWIRAAAGDELPEDHGNDGKAEHDARGSRTRKKNPTRHK